MTSAILLRSPMARKWAAAALRSPSVMPLAAISLALRPCAYPARRRCHPHPHHQAPVALLQSAHGGLLQRIRYGNQQRCGRQHGACNGRAASIKPAALAAPPKLKSKALVECQLDAAFPMKGVVIECSGSSVTVLDVSNHATTHHVDKVSEVKTSFAVAAQDRNGRTVRCV